MEVFHLSSLLFHCEQWSTGKGCMFRNSILNSRFHFSMWTCLIYQMAMGDDTNYNNSGLSIWEKIKRRLNNTPVEIMFNYLVFHMIYWKKNWKRLWQIFITILGCKLFQKTSKDFIVYLSPETVGDFNKELL